MLQQIEKSLTYRVRSSGLYSDSFRITVNPAPVITGLQATTTFPEYTQLPPASVNLLTGGTPSAANAVVPMMPALLGARVTVTGTANLPISEAELMRDATAVKSKPAANAAQYSWEFEVGAVPADAESMVQECNVRLISDRQVPARLLVLKSMSAGTCRQRLKSGAEHRHVDGPPGPVAGNPIQRS